MRIIQCGYCGHKDFEDAFRHGRGREFGEHPEHRYCERCGQSIDWHGFKVIWIGGVDDGSTGSKNSAFIRQAAGRN